MDYNQLTDLISRYKAGKATPDEIALLDKMWSDVNKDEAFATDHTSKELEHIKSGMLMSIQDQIQRQQGIARVSTRPLVFKIAASVLLVVAFSVFWYASSNGMNEVRTGFGEHRTVILPDSSKVILNGNSVLRYAARWDADLPREVWIEGEGFFSVKHTRTGQKFIVHGTDKINVEVLGTKFNIKTRNCQSEVMLTEGKLKVALNGDKPSKGVFLVPGDLATVQNKDIKTRSVRPHKYTSWVDNKLTFERTSLSDLAIILRDTYGLTVTFKNPGLEKRQLSGEISSATADDILFAIAETFDLHVVREGHSVSISGNDN